MPIFTLSCDDFTFQTDVLSDGISYSKAANFNTQIILNRSSAHLTFANSSAIEMSVPIRLLAHDRENWNVEDIHDVVIAMMSLEYPGNRSLDPPPLCRVTLGSGYIFSSWLCVCQNVSVVEHQTIYDSNGDVLEMSVSLQLVGIELKSVSREEIKGLKSGTFSNLKTS